MNTKSLKATNIILLIFLLSACTEKGSYVRALSPSFSCYGECSLLVDSLFNSNSLSDLFITEVASSDTVIQFGDYVGYQENSVILLKDNYEAESGTYLIRIGSDDGFRLFLNNELIGENLSRRGLHPDTDWIVTDLQSGNNELVFQVDQSDGSWGLHYNIEPYDEEKLKKLILEHIPEIYSDLPESCILPDSASHLTFKLDTRIKHDQLYILRYRWVDIFDNTNSLWIEYTANVFPNRIDLPKNFNGFKILDYELINQDGDLLYKERIPIFSNKVASQKVLEFKFFLQEDLTNRAYLENLSLQYPGLFGKEKELDFSTRHKAEFLLDLMLLVNEDLSFSGGPRTELFNGKLLRTYTPHTKTESQDLVVGFHVELDDSVNHYFKTYAGKSHAKMVEWNSYVQASGNTLIMPFIKPGDKSLNISAFNENYFKMIDTNRFEIIKVVSWSKGVPILINSLSTNKLPYDEVHFISSWLVISEENSFKISNALRKKNPSTRYIFFHAESDSDVPYSFIKTWDNSFKNRGLNSELILIPNSTHWYYWESPEKLFL